MAKVKIEIRVRKMLSGNGYRFRYGHKGKDARAIGDYNIAEMKEMDKIEFTFADNITKKEKSVILEKWKTKL